MSFWNRYDVVNALRRANRVVQVLLILCLMFLVNSIFLRHYWRTDLTEDRMFSLSPESVAYIRQIERPIEIVVTIPENPSGDDVSILLRYTKGILREIEYTAHRYRIPITVRFVDIYRDTVTARRLEQQYGLRQPNSVLVASDVRHRIVLPTEILEFDDLRPTKLQGEEAIISAMLEVASDSRRRIYFVKGHGEMDTDSAAPDRGLSLIADEMSSRNLAVEKLDLVEQGRVPEDADLVIICDPQGPLMEAELEMLRVFLIERAGSAIILLRPGVQHGMDELLHEWGILADDRAILETHDDYMAGDGSYLIRRFGQHPVTSMVIRNETYVVSGVTRPIRPDPGRSADERLRTTAIMGSSDRSWAEAEYMSNGVPAFDPETDLQGPVPIGMAAERGASSKLGIQIEGGRLIVVGSGDILANNRIGNLGNYSLIFSMVNWTISRDELLAIEPRPITQYQLTVSGAEMRNLVLGFLLVPVGLGCFSLLIQFTRRL